MRRSTAEQATTQAKGLLYRTLISVFTCMSVGALYPLIVNQWFLLAAEELYYAKHALSSG